MRGCLKPRLQKVLPLILLAMTLLGTSGSPDEERLYRDLLRSYHKMARPVVNTTAKVDIEFGATLQYFDIDVQTNEITMNIWIKYSWNDYRLRWDPEEYAQLKDIRVMPDKLWIPDIIPYNLLPNPRLDWLSPVPVVISSNGDLLYVAPTSTRTSCRRYHIELDNFSCEIKFGSWTFSGFALDLIKPSLDLSSLVVNPMWDLKNYTMKRHEIYYDCCPEPYIDVTLDLQIGRRTPDTSDDRWVAWPNLAVAVTLTLSLASFLVPVTSHQKLTLPSLAVIAAGTAVVAEFGLNGTAEYRLHFLRVYHAYTYVALGCLLWAVLMVVLGRPRALGLPNCARACLRSWLSAVCCLASSPVCEDKTTCHEWTALAEMLDRVAAVIFSIFLCIGSLASSRYSY